MRRLYLLARTLHIYLTLLGLLVILFFAVTGFMMNHDEWFSGKAVAVHEAEGQLDKGWIEKADRLEIVERLRRDFAIRQNMSDYEPEDQSIRVVFKGPGRTADAEIDRESGHVRVRLESRGVSGLLADLHKGSETGRTWRWLLDAVAIVLTLACLTGLFLWFFLTSRRVWGILWLTLGAAAVAGLLLTAI